VAYSPDGKRIASGSSDGLVKLWDAETGQETLTLKAASEVRSLALGPDGNSIAAGTSDGTIEIWDCGPPSEGTSRDVDRFDPVNGGGGPKVIEFHPANADAWWTLGLTCQSHHQWAKAIDSYSKVIELKPNHWELWQELGQIHVEREQWSEAAADFPKA